MVAFCCDGCGETLKRNQVDRHATRCKSCYSVSCVACNLSFGGDDFRHHTSCVTEAERYEKRSVSKNVKKSPQEQWMDLVRSSAKSAPAHLKVHLKSLTKCDNLPRKEKQFRNFTENSLNLRGSQRTVVGEVWEHLKSLREQQMKERAARAASSTPDVDGEARESKSMTEAKQQQKDGENQDVVPEKVEPAETAPSAKVVEKAVKKALKASGNQLSFKVLRKKVQLQFGLKKSKMKQMVKDVCAKDRFEVDGDTIRLRPKD